MTIFPIHQRLNAQHQQFCQWLVGFTEGDGCFSLDKNGKTWTPCFKIALQRSDYRTLIYIQRHLQCGKFSWANKERTMIQYRIRSTKQLQTTIFPIFEAYPMITNKDQDFQIIQQATQIILENSEERQQRLQSLAEELQAIRARRKHLPTLLKDRVMVRDPILYCENLGISVNFFLKNSPKNYNQIPTLPLSPASYDSSLREYHEFCQVVSKCVSCHWFIGFFAAEGSFYITTKDQNSGRLCHGFGISQKTPFVLEVIKRKWHIPAQVKERTVALSDIKGDFIFYQLDSTNNRVNAKIKLFCWKQFVGLASLKYRIWARSLTTSNGRRKKQAQELLRKLSKPNSLKFAT